MNMRIESLDAGVGSRGNLGAKAQKARTNGIAYLVDSELRADYSAFDDVLAFTPFDIQDLLKQTRLLISDSAGGAAAPSVFIAGVILAAENAALRDRVVARCRLLLPHFDESMIFVCSALDASACAWIARSAASLSARMVIEARRADQQNAEMRILYEKAQAALSDVERTQAKVHSPRIVLQVLPGEKELKISPARTSFSVHRECSTIHAIDLFFNKKPSAGDGGDVVLEMRGAQSGRELAVWRVRYENIEEEWNRFYCPVFHEPIGENISLSISTTSATPPVSLRSAAQTEGLKALFLTTEGQEPVALRLWSGLLGVHLPHTHSGHSGHSADGQNLTDPGSVSRVELLQLGSAVSVERAAQVMWSDAHGGLMVHPQGASPVVARIPMLTVSGVSAIRVACKLAHPAAATTHFAAWIVRAGETVAVRTSLAQQAGERMSRLLRGCLFAKMTDAAAMPARLDWLTLTGGQEGELSLPVEPPHTGSLDLFLATRNPTHDSRYAWAIFTDVRFEVSST